jgi:type IV pilus assembly protein PilY1
VSETVAAGGDDGYWDDMGTFDNTGTTMNVGYTGMGMTEDSYARFTTVALPQGQTILTATLTFIVGANASAAFDMAIRGEDIDDSAQHASQGDASGATLTTASVTWTGDSGWETGDTAESPSITTIIQEIIDRGSWATGNDLTLQVKYAGSSSTEAYQFKTFDDDSTVAAVLTVTY